MSDYNELLVRPNSSLTGEIRPVCPIYDISVASHLELSFFRQPKMSLIRLSIKMRIWMKENNSMRILRIDYFGIVACVRGPRWRGHETTSKYTGRFHSQHCQVSCWQLSVRAIHKYQRDPALGARGETAQLCRHGRDESPNGYARTEFGGRYFLSRVARDGQYTGYAITRSRSLRQTIARARDARQLVVTSDTAF